jgi:hypothetical protein
MVPAPLTVRSKERMTTATVIFLIVAIAAVAAAIGMYAQMSRTRKLRNHFGPEYHRTLEQERGRTTRAESLLEQRQKRVSRLNIRPLSREECERFIAEWSGVEGKFIDDPHGAVSMADALVNDVMRARNYPMTDFEQRAEDISVEHPQVVHNYRLAHEVAAGDVRREASTEDLRRAIAALP